MGYEAKAAPDGQRLSAPKGLARLWRAPPIAVFPVCEEKKQHSGKQACLGGPEVCCRLKTGGYLSQDRTFLFKEQGKMRKSLIIFVLIAAVAAIGFWGKKIFFENKATKAQYRFAKVERRDIINSVSCSGELSAVVTVEVGSEISGQITELSVDYNSQVKEGDIIARLAPESYQALVRQAEAELALYKAKLLTQKATVVRCQADLQNVEDLLAASQAQTKKTRATMANAEQNFERKQALVKQGFISKNDYDVAKTTFAEVTAQLEQSQAQGNAAVSKVASSKAGLIMAKAQIKEAEAQIQLKTAALDKRRFDLDNTIIRSPVNGVVIDRRVDEGQTVSASLQAPTLFTIAKDLTKMQVSASEDEADIGRIREDQAANFTVDAFGSLKFTGRVTQIRKAGKTIQNVVTYTVIISADNPDLSLMPGMTADVEIEILKKSQVLVVANAALRFTQPDAEQNDSVNAQAATNSGAQSGLQSGRGGRRNPEERVKQLTEALNLSQDQQENLREMFQKIRIKIKAARQSDDFNPTRKGALRDKARKETHITILRILTPEQRPLYEQLVSGKRQNRLKKGAIWNLDETGTPKRIQVILGISDGTYTEISGPKIEPGMQVITGIR